MGGVLPAVDVAGARRACSTSLLNPVQLPTLAHHAPARALVGVSRFTHPSFAPRTLKQQTVCIVCQRWFCNIKNPDPKSRFYNTFQKPECYFLWLGDRADTPQAQAAFLAAPYKGEGRLRNGWRQKEQAACGRCMNAAKSPEAQANNNKAIKNRTTDQLVSGHLCTVCGNRKADGKNTGQGREPCAACAAKRAAKAAAAPAPPTT